MSSKMSLAQRVSELAGRMLSGSNAQRRMMHGILLASVPLIVLTAQPGRNPAEVNIDNYNNRLEAAAKEDDSLKMPAIIRTASSGARFTVLSTGPSGASGEYQVIAKLLTLRDSPDGKITGYREIGDVVNVLEATRLGNVEWGKTDYGYIALSEDGKPYAEKPVKSNTLITPGGINYLERLLWTEITPYLDSYPEADYKTAIMNVINVIDNRASSGIFPSTVLGVSTKDSQFSGLTDSGLSGLLKAGNLYRTDNLGLEELAGHYGAENKPPVIRSIGKKLSLIEEVVGDYLKNGMKDPMPLCVLFFKNDNVAMQDWGIPYARDPASLGKNRHSYYLSDKCAKIN